MIAVILGVGVAASLLKGGADTAALESPLSEVLTDLYRVTTRTVWRVFILIAGSTLLLLGAALLVLPGPGLLTLAVGLAVLGTQFVWARVWYARVRALAEELGEDAQELLSGRRRKRGPDRSPAAHGRDGRRGSPG